MPCSCGYMQDGELYFYIKDYQGNVRVVLNQANQPVEVNSYYPYGGLMAATTTEGSQPYKYGTKELDRENGLDWYDSKARMYDPTIGRTPTQDPMAEKYYSISPYLWCAANPITFTDPTGAIVQIDSTKMTSEQYQYVISTLNLLMESSLFAKVYSELDENPDVVVNITFGETIAAKDENGNQMSVDAQYSAETKNVTLRIGSSPTMLQFAEEVYHAKQDMDGNLTNLTYNVEFEAKTAALIFAGEAGGPRSIPKNGIPKSYQDGLYNCSLDKTGISKYVKDNYVINGTFFQKYWRKSGNRHYSAPVKTFLNL